MTAAATARAVWGRRPRWVLTRPVRTVEAMNTDRVLVRGLPRYDPGPSLFAVAFYGETRPRLPQLLWYLAAPRHRLVPRRVVFGGLGEAEFESTGHEVTRVSRLCAVRAAAGWLGLAEPLRGSGALVTAVDRAGAAGAVLDVDDVVVAVDGAPVGTASEAVRALGNPTESGRDDTIELRVLRARVRAGDGSPELVTLPRGARLGVRLTTHRPVLDPGVDVEIRQDPESSGPSAGLVGALAVLDVLTPGRLTGDLRVAATGTIDAEGRVGAVAGVDLKALSAHRCGMDLFLVPPGAGPEARAGLPRGSRVEIVEVGTLDEAVTVLVAHGGTRPRRSA